MGTLVTITLYAPHEKAAAEGFRAAFARIAHLDRTLSDYDPASELSRVCESPARLSPDLRVVVEHGQRLARETGGAFDITAGALIRIWREARKQRRLPAAEALRAARHRSGFRNLKVRGGRARCLVEGLRLDAGGIAKGYAADEALRALREVGIRRALVAVSGDIAAGDPPPDKPAWRVRVQDTTIALRNAAVSTSGDEYQYMEVDGVRYSHIIDPRTGEALRNMKPVSVVARSGLEADSLSTAIAVLGPGWDGKIARSRVLRLIAEW